MTDNQWVRDTALGHAVELAKQGQIDTQDILKTAREFEVFLRDSQTDPVKAEPESDDAYAYFKSPSFGPRASYYRIRRADRTNDFGSGTRSTDARYSDGDESYINLAYLHSDWCNIYNEISREEVPADFLLPKDGTNAVLYGGGWIVWDGTNKAIFRDSDGMYEESHYTAESLRRDTWNRIQRVYVDPNVTVRSVR